MERAKHEYYASILAVVLLLAPQLSFARGMSGGAAGRAGSSSFTSVGSGSARMGFSGPRAVAGNPSGALMAARRIQPFTTTGARPSARSSFFSILPNGRHVDFRHRPRTIINRLHAPLIVVPFPPFYVPVPVPSYSDENPYPVDNSVSLPADNGDYTPPSDTTDPAAASSESLDRQDEYAFHARDYMAANRAWQHAIVDDPSNGALAMKLALAMFAVDKYREAAGTTQQVLMLLPQEKWGQAVSDYKKLYANPKDYLDQLKSLAKAAADKPHYP